MESFYGIHIGPAIAWSLSRITGFVPVSVAELLIAAFVARLLVGLARALAACRRGERRWRNAVATGTLRLGQDAGLVIALFYLLWGMQYGRPPVEERFAWEPGNGAPLEVIDDLAAKMIAVANDAYREIHGTDDDGVPTTIGGTAELAMLDRAIEVGWSRATGQLGVKGPASWTFGPTKRLLISPLLDRLGLSGFYFPFTGEANVNRGVPAVSYPQVVAHEKSHQRGVCPEDEANFFGYLAAALSPDANARYSAAVFAQRQLLFALSERAPDRVTELVEGRLPGVQRDVDDLRAYWRRFRGPARTVSRAMNDAYLKTNRVEGGVASYGRSVELLIAYSRTREGDLR